MLETNVIKIFSELGDIETELSGKADLNREFELITTAKQYDWRYGEFEFKKKELEEMAENFNNDLLGIEVAVDKNHSSDKLAYAWIQPQSMFVSKSTKLKGQYSLYAKLHRFTPEGEKLVTTGAYRYFSLEIRNKFEKVIDGTKKIFKNVISGLALTNMPVIKDMAPTFSENNNNLSLNSYNNMETIKKMLSELNSQDTVTRAEKDLLNKAVSVLSEEEAKEVKEEVEAVEAKPEQSEEEKKKEEEKKEEAEKEKELAEKKEEERKAQLSEVELKFEEQQKELAELKANVKAEKVSAITEGLMLSENNTTGFVADFKPSVEGFLNKLTIEEAKEFSELIKNIKTVELGSKGSSSTNKTLGSEESLDKKATAYAKEHKVTYAEALKEVA